MDHHEYSVLANAYVWHVITLHHNYHSLTHFSLYFTNTAYIGSSYSSGYPSMTRDLNCTQFQATIGLSVYALGFGVAPLFSAALSEEFGRQPLYLVSTLVFMLMQLGVALSVAIILLLIIFTTHWFSFKQSEKYRIGSNIPIHRRRRWVYGVDYGGRDSSGHMES